MATWTPHTYVTFGGALVANTEIWQCGVRVVKASGGGPLADHDAYLATIAPSLSAWFSGSTAGGGSLRQNSSLKWVKANPIGSNGHYSDQATHVHDYPSPVLGATGGLYPDITTVAISWGTNKSIRKGVYATHGRIYPPNFPANGETIDVSGMRIKPLVAAGYVELGHALLQLLTAGSVATPVVASGKDGSINPITHVRVGDVVDVQRHRKDALKEVYTTAPFPGP